MSFERLLAYEAVCDHNGCPLTSETLLPPKYMRNRPREARASARAQGWTIFADGSAFCPEHKPRPSGSEASCQSR